MLTSEALTKIQSIFLIAVVVITAVGGATYVLLSGEEQSSETIKIGILADLDGYWGKHAWQGAILAAEQINAESGILGRQVEIVAEDHDIETETDIIKVDSALTRLITYHNVDFIIGQGTGEAGIVCQDMISEHKKIYFEVTGILDELTQRVLDNYDKYKYYFRVFFNASSIFQDMTKSLLLLRDDTGFNKIGYLGEDLLWTGIMEGLNYFLPENGFDLVYKGKFPLGTLDFSSYFAAAEAAGVEILTPIIAMDGSVPFVKEYYDRQSPMIVYSGILGGGIPDPQGWEITDGKCEFVSAASWPIVAGYPLTSKTLPSREAFINRWGEIPNSIGGSGYDIVRFILADAINRAGTTETDEVVKALEETNIETSNARNFVFTTDHDTMMGENMMNPDEDYWLVLYFQWQNGEQVPVYPTKIMEEAGATLTFPDWSGPWDNLNP